MVDEFPRLGPDKAWMVKPDPDRPEGRWLGKLAHGGDQIRALLSSGWLIKQDARNHITGDYGQQPPSMPNVETHTAAEPPKRKRGRPRIIRPVPQTADTETFIDPISQRKKRPRIQRPTHPAAIMSGVHTDET